MDISYLLSRFKRKGQLMHMVLLPLVFKELLTRVPDRIKSAQYLRVSAERDTAAEASDRSHSDLPFRGFSTQRAGPCLRGCFLGSPEGDRCRPWYPPPVLEFRLNFENALGRADALYSPGKSKELLLKGSMSFAYPRDYALQRLALFAIEEAEAPLV